MESRLEQKVKKERERELERTKRELDGEIQTKSGLIVVARYRQLAAGRFRARRSKLAAATGSGRLLPGAAAAAATTSTARLGAAA